MKHNDQHIVDFDMGYHPGMTLGKVLFELLKEYEEGNHNSIFRIHQVAHWKDDCYVAILNEYAKE